MAKKLADKKCPICGESFSPYIDDSPYCSAICREKRLIKQANEAWLKRDNDKAKKKYSSPFGVGNNIYGKRTDN